MESFTHKKSDKVVIFDLDETLVHTNESYKLDSVLDNYIPINSKLYVVNTVYDVEDDNIKTANMWGLTRPYFRELIDFCFDRFNKVIIWSAGTERYVRDVVKKIFSKIRNPDFIFTRKDLLTADTEEGGTKSILYLAKQNPVLGINLKNTIVIDDKEYNFLENKDNGVLIPEYLPLEGPLFYKKGSLSKNKKVSSIENDGILLQLENWMKQSGVLSTDDVRGISKDNIFSGNNENINK